MGADEVSAVDMGYIFEELVRKISESYDEQARAHFTACDIICYYGNKKVESIFLSIPLLASNNLFYK